MLFRSEGTRRVDDSSVTSASTNRANVISISGGYRDEMIPPKACYLDNDNQKDSNFYFSIISTDIMIPASIEGKEYVPPYIGVDHRAIVWCHHILSQVRYILYTLIHTLDGIDEDGSHESSHHLNSQNIQKEQELRRKLLGLPSSSTLGDLFDYLQSLSTLHISLKVNTLPYLEAGSIYQKSKGLDGIN